MPHIKLLLVNLKKTKPENIFLGISNWNQVEDNSLINTNSCSASLAKMAVNSESGALWLHPLCFVLLWNCISENKLTLVWFCPLFFKLIPAVSDIYSVSCPLFVLKHWDTQSEKRMCCSKDKMKMRQRKLTEMTFSALYLCIWIYANVKKDFFLIKVTNVIFI